MNVLDQIRSLPVWDPAVEIEPLKGGLSNESYTVHTATSKYVVRIGVDYPCHHVYRDRELMTARAAHKAGFAPQVVYAEPGFTVSRFIEGKTYDEADVQENLAAVAKLVREFHLQMPRHVSGAAFMFWPFHVIRDYALTLREGGGRKVGSVSSFIDIATKLESQQVSLPIVFGHHDLLPANFIEDEQRLWLIDFEYAGFGTGMFDLAGIASNAQLGEDRSRELLHMYYDENPSDDLLRSHAAMQCASLLREVMWSMVSELHLDAPGVDYVAYTEENLVRFDASLDAYQSTYGVL